MKRLKINKLYSDEHPQLVDDVSKGDGSVIFDGEIEAEDIIVGERPTSMEDGDMYIKGKLTCQDIWLN